AGAAEQEGRQGDGAGYLDRVIPRLPVGEEVAGGRVGALGDAVDDDLDRARPATGVEDDRVVVSRAADRQRRLGGVGGVGLQGHGGHVEGARGGLRQVRGPGRQLVRPILRERQVAEGGDAVGGRHGGRPAEDRPARAGGDGEGDAGRARADQVV